MAAINNEIFGYLTGCLDTRRYNRIMMREIIPKAAAGAVARGALGRMETWRLLTAFAGSGILRAHSKIDLDMYPAHFHINLMQDFRGKKTGRRLVERFKREAAGIKGIHVEVLSDNELGRRFFESMGFTLLHKRTLILPEGRWFCRTFTVVYGWTREN